MIAAGLKEGSKSVSKPYTTLQVINAGALEIKEMICWENFKHLLRKSIVAVFKNIEKR